MTRRSTPDTPVVWRLAHRLVAKLVAPVSATARSFGDQTRLDVIARHVAHRRSRRVLFRAGGAAVFAAVAGGEPIGAGAHGRRALGNRCKRHRQCRTGRCARNGRCTCPAGEQRCHDNCIPRSSCCDISQCEPGQICDNELRCCIPEFSECTIGGETPCCAMNNAQCAVVPDQQTPTCCLPAGVICDPGITTRCCTGICLDTGDGGRCA